MKSLLHEIANQYIDFYVEGKKVDIPYCIVQTSNEIKHPFDMARTDRYTNYAGKGTPEQIQDALHNAANKKAFDLKKASSKEITEFMITEGIGIDCSGFVYNVLDRNIQKTKRISLDAIILRFPGLLGKTERFLLRKNRVRRSNGTTLTSDLNTIRIEKIKDIQPGDMIRLTVPDWEGKHPVLIVDVDKTYITYAQSSEYTKIQGPHFGQIEIIDPHKGLESQNWLEITQNGENYGKIAFDPKRGDSVRRLKILA